MGSHRVGHDWVPELSWYLSLYLSSTYLSIYPTFYQEWKKMIIRIFRTAVCWAGGWCVQSLSCVQLFALLWTIARQAALSTGFSRQEHLCCLVLVQGTFLTQGWNLHLLRLLHWQIFFFFFFFTTKLPGKPRRMTEIERLQRSFTFITWDLLFLKFFGRCAGICMII